MDQVSERRSVERHSSSGTRRLTLVDLPAPFTLKPVKVDGIISYDIDNAYPSRMERLINSSVTAKAAAGMYARFLSGQGFADESLNTVIVGKDNFRSITALELLRKIAASISKFNGVYVRAQFTGYNPSAFRIEPFRYCRLGEMDDRDFNAKVVVYNNWDRWRSQKLEKGKCLAVDVWNPLKEVIDAQVAAAGSFNKWKGQMYYSFLDDEYIYPLSPIDVIKWDADTESQIAIFKNGELRRGFFLKYILHHTKFNTDDEADDFVKKMQGFMGGDHEKAMMVLEGSFGPDGKIIDGENVKLEKIEQNINDKMFDIKPQDEHDLVASSGLRVESAAIKPGETRTITIYADDALWETYRLVSLINEPDGRFAALLMFYDDEGTRYLNEIQGPMIPSFG